MAKRHRLSHTADRLEKLKYEVAKELNLEKDIEVKGFGEMPTREVGRIGGNMVKKMIEAYEGKEEKN